MARLVSCTVKNSTGSVYEQLTGIGGLSNGTHWSISVEKVIAQIQAGEETYYVIVDGHTPNLSVGIHEGVKYLKTPWDTGSPLTLLKLPDCPKQL